MDPLTKRLEKKALLSTSSFKRCMLLDTVRGWQSRHTQLNWALLRDLGIFRAPLSSETAGEKIGKVKAGGPQNQSCDLFGTHRALMPSHNNAC